MAVRFVFTLEDLARMRFAISPQREVIRSLVVLRDPSHAALHLPWLRSLSGNLAGLDLERAVALTPAAGFMPDFLTPPPSGPFGNIEDDLATLRATPAAQIRAEMDLFESQHPKAIVTVTRWRAHPQREVRHLADLLAAYWTRAIQPSWPRIKALLDADIAHRARQLAAGGPAALFADLAAGVTWTPPYLDVEVPRHEATIELDGAGLLLMPSAFAATRPGVMDRAPWQNTLIYPARGVGLLWEEPAPAPDGLARLLGATRAAMLADLGAPRTTTDVARRLKISPATASHHLTALRDGGLATARREGRTVLYVRTPVGDALSAA